MHPFLAALLAVPLAAETTSPPTAPGFDVSPTSFPTLAAADVKPEEFGKWHGSISLGASFSDGNTDRTTVSATAKAENRRERDRITLELLWNYAEEKTEVDPGPPPVEDDVITQRRTYGSAKYDYFFTEKLYGLVQASGESDIKAMLDLRTIFGVGAGYQFREDERWKVSGEAGLAYVDEDYKDDSADADYLAARLAYKVDWTPNEKCTVGQGAQIYPSLENSDDVNSFVDTHAKLTLTDNMFAQLQWLFTWDNTPATGADRVDNLYLLTLGWSF